MTLPIRLDYVKQVVRDVVASGVTDLPAGRIAWVRMGIPRPARPYISLQIIAGPFTDVTKEERRFVEMIDSSTVTIDSATVGERYRIRVNGFSVDYTAIGGDGVTEIRDGLLANAALSSNYVTGESVSFAASGADAILITPSSPGELVGVRTPNSSITIVDSKSDAWASYQVSRDIMSVQVTAYDSDTLDEESLSAKMISRRIQKKLDSVDTEELTLGARVGIRQISNITDLSGLEPGGAKLQGQSQFDIEVTASSLSITEVNPIDTVETTVDVGIAQAVITTP